MIKFNLPPKAACLLVLSFLFSNAYAQVRYVKVTSTGTGDGSSWANASSDLQAMIQASPAGGEVWVQAGTYFPNTKPYSGASPIVTPDPRDVTFHIKDNVSLFGGFSGTETAINQRDISLNETILSGDIGVIGDSTDNAYHVVMLVQTAFAIQDGALDGFTIKEGNANGTGSVSTLLYASLRNYGGGIYTSYANGSIKNCKITSCASTSGGAIYFSRSTMNVDYCTVFGNRSASKGGGIYVSSDQAYSTLTVNHSDFFDNRSTNEAGAFYMNYGSLTMDNCTFYNNLAGGLGSGFWGSYNTLTIYNCQFYQNQSSGGALYLFQGVGTISSCSFYNNQGGGISLSNNLTGDILLENNDFHDNSANNGAALAFNGGRTVIRRNLFYDNTAVTRGGAIYFIPLSQPDSPTNNYSVVEQNIFINNQTTHVATLNGGYGGAWFSQNGQHKMINNLYLSNSANRGGAIFGQGAKINLENNTFYGNSANYDGGAMALFSDTDTLINNIFSANTKGSNLSSDVEQTQPGSSAAFYNNSLQSATIASYAFATANSGNFFQADPLFVDESDFDGLDNLFFTGDDGLNLQECSPLIDTGIVASAVSTDIAGNLRIQHATIDLGAYETSYENTIPNSVILSGGGAYCAGDSGIVVDIDNPEPGVVYHLLLNGVETGDTLALSGASDFGYQTAAGNYTVLAETISSNCVWEMDTVLVISIYDLPLVEMNVIPAVICEGQSIVLNPSGATVYHWSDTTINSGVPFIPVNGATYVLTGTDSNGCTNTDTLIVNALPLPDNGIIVNDVTTLSASLNGVAYQWIDCNSGQPLAGETNQVFTAAQNGTYAVVVNNGNCSDTSDCMVIDQVGLETIEKAVFSLSPNPVSSNLTIYCTETNGEFTLLDQQGRVLQQFQVEENILLHLDHFAQGIYILRLQTDFGVFEKRFIKQ